MTYREMNILTSIFIVDFSLGVKTPYDLETQEFLTVLRHEYAYKIGRVFHFYGIDRRLENIDQTIKNSTAEVTIAEDGFVEMRDGNKRVSFKMKSIDVYLKCFLEITEDYKYYPLLKFLFSFTPYLEFFVFLEGLERLKSPLKDR